MIRSLRARMILAIVLITLAASTVVGVGLGRFTRHEFNQFLEVEAEFEALDLPDPGRLIELLRAGDRPGATAEVEAMSGRTDGARLLLFDHERTLIADTRPQGEARLGPDGSLEISGSREADGHRREERMTVRGGLTLGRPDEALGTLYVLPQADRGPRSRPETGFRRTISRAHLIGVLVATGLALVIALILSGRILGPVERLTRAARQLEQGDLGQRVYVRSRDEIGELSQAFNSMAGSLERQETARRNMVGDIAHELRTPLTHLRCKIESVQDGLLPADGPLLDGLHQEIVHLGRLVDDLQELALAEAGRLPLFPVDAAPGPVVRQLVASLPTIDDGPVVNVEITDDLPAMHVDVDRFRQVLRNLLQNALRHADDGGRIVVRATNDDGSIRCEVEDDGPGIPGDHLEKVFDRFHRTDPSRDRATGGAGLGLAIARQLVEAWGGTIGVESEPERGAKFWFTVPSSGNAGSENGQTTVPPHGSLSA